VQSGAGLHASYIDDAYAQADADIVDVNTAFAPDIVLAV
jgi:H+-translocating NAD(P) transhydrogenase subunit alpha